MRPLSTPMKATIVGVSISLAIIGVLATIFRRRKARPPRKPGNGCDITTLSSRPSAKSPNVDNPSSHHSQSNSPSLGQLSRRHTNSTCSAAPSSISTITTHNLDTGNMSPQHLCQLGLDSLNSAIDHWQEALLRIEDETDASTIVNCDVVDHESHGSHGTNDLRSQIESLLDRANGIQQEYQRRLYRQASAAALDSALSALSEMDRVYERERRTTMSDDSDQDSFVSASEMADLSDLDNQNLRYQHLFLYKAALLELEHGCIPCRELRTKTVMCSSDAEFLAKLHCLRLGFEELFSNESVLSWFIETGKQLLTDLLIKADRDPEDFRAAFDQTIEFVSEADNRKSIEEELRGRGVKILGFYDLVLDFILMDAFDDLESPPSSVTAVLQNRWLSNGFKETCSVKNLEELNDNESSQCKHKALSTAVWSVLKAKRRLLKVPNGFISHFYSISEHISPVLAWGFLGPDEKLRELCYFFKDQVMEFLHKAFSFSHVRYTTIPELADDILYLAKEQCQIIGNALSS